MSLGGVILTVLGTLAVLAILGAVVGWLCGKVLDSNFFR